MVSQAISQDGDSPLPGQAKHNEGGGPQLGESARQKAGDSNMVDMCIDIPLQDLISIKAFGNIQMQGTKVTFFNPEAVPVLKQLFGKEISKIGDNMVVTSAKDIFMILDEYAKLGAGSDALVRFHCRGLPGDVNESEILEKMEKLKKVMGPDGQKKARGSILRGGTQGLGLSAASAGGEKENGNDDDSQQASEATDLKKSRESGKSVVFNGGDSVVAVEAFMTEDLAFPEHGESCTDCIMRNFGCIGSVVFLAVILGAMFAMSGS